MAMPAMKQRMLQFGYSMGEQIGGLLDNCLPVQKLLKQDKTPSKIVKNEQEIIEKKKEELLNKNKIIENPLKKPV